jgi:uncharacterized protein
MMNELIKENIDKIIEICKNNKVKSLFVFGSAATDKFNMDSDIDLLISFEKMNHGEYAETYFDVAEKFEGILNKHVDLVTERSMSNPYFIESVNRTKLLIYAN